MLDSFCQWNLPANSLLHMFFGALTCCHSPYPSLSHNPPLTCDQALRCSGTSHNVACENCSFGSNHQNMCLASSKYGPRNHVPCLTCLHCVDFFRISWLEASWHQLMSDTSLPCVPVQAAPVKRAEVSKISRLCACSTWALHYQFIL